MTTRAVASPKARDQASEVTQFIAALVVDRAVMPHEAAADLKRLLGHRLAVSTVAHRRHAQLGLLIDLVSSGTGEFIATTTYEEARQKRRHARGEEWPTPSALSRAYGHWLHAHKAACRYWFDGGQGKVPSNYAHTKRSHAYKPQEIVRALLQAQQELGLRGAVGDTDWGSGAVSPLRGSRWPTEWEYFEWARIKRRLARLTGNSCRVPERLSIQTAFGNYAAAARAAEGIEGRTADLSRYTTKSPSS